MLGNSSLSLEFSDGVVRARNHLSGTVTDFACPGFAVALSGGELRGADFDFDEPQVEPGRVTLIGRHEATGLEAKVAYTLADDEPWFRKQVTLHTPEPMPTPDRLLVDVQSDAPAPIRRVGYGLRGGPDAEEQAGLDTYVPQPGCGYPVYAGDWFMGVEHPSGFAVPGERLELYHHPVWSDEGVIESFAAVFGVAETHMKVADAFMDYVWRIRRPRLERPFLTFTSGWSTRAIGHGEYIAGYESNLAFLEAMVDLGLRPDAMAIDAGYFERRSIFHHKGDDAEDSLFRTFAGQVHERGLELSVWVSHNGRTGFDMDWIREQGWETGDGPGTYTQGDFVVMMQPSFEEALAERFSRIVGEIGARHLKIDWDNECATNGRFAEQYPTTDHVREASLLAFNRIDTRMREANPELLTRNGWWPSPWWLQWADHVWLATSGDGEYAMWPSRTQRDREMTHRDAVYHQISRVSETPCPLDAYDNHGFAHAVDNPFSQQPHTWLDNAVMQFTRGCTYLHMPICPESLDADEARVLQQTMDWMRHHGEELGTQGTCMVGGSPAEGEIYGYLHPSASSAWLVLRNPDPRPQVYGGASQIAMALGWAPRTWRQVHPYWQDLQPLAGITLLGHEVRLIRLEREPQADPSPVPGAAFVVSQAEGGFEYCFPGFAPLTEAIGPTVHPDMQIPEITAERTADEAIEGGWRRQWYCGIPHRLEGAELLVTMRGDQADLDGLTVQCTSTRYRATAARGHLIPGLRIFRNEERGYGTAKFMPPVGARDRDDWAFEIPDGGYGSLTLDILGEGAERVSAEVWITGWEALARQTIVQEAAPADGPLLPPHPYGFSRCVRI